jgi:TonB family protein
VLAPRRAYAQAGDAGSAEPSPAQKTAEEPRGRSGAVIREQKPDEPPPPAPQPVTITPPKLLRDDGAPYPSQAVRDGVRETRTVELVITIDAAGTVTNAVVDGGSGRADFDDAAVEAAKKAQFEPARRNGQPVATKIRHRYVFAPPPARIVGRVTSDKDAPIAGAKIVARAPDGSERTVTSGADGEFVIEPLPFGKYSVAVGAPGFRAQTGDEELDPGEEAAMTLRLAPEAGAAAAADGKKDEAIEEVRVRGLRPPREVTRRTLDQREHSRIPGTNGDALRAIQYMPGVARPPGLLGVLIVRGSNPQDTNVFVDGTLIPLAYHFGGLSSVIPTELLEKIDFYPGNFSAQYGRVMGGIVDIGVRDPKKDRFHGMAQLDLIDVRMLVETPLGKGWSVAAAGRRSWIDAWLKPVLKGANVGVVTAPVYYDYQFIVEKDFSPRENLRFLFIGSDDRLDLVTPAAQVGGLSAHTGFWRFQARYRNKFSADTELKIAPAIGQDFVDFEVGDNLFRIDAFPITSRIELGQRISKGVATNFGFDILFAPYEVRLRAPPIPRPGEPPAGPFLNRPPLQVNETDTFYRPGMYTELELTPYKYTRIVPGFRADYAKDIERWDLAPRFIARQEVVHEFPKTALKGGIGVFKQPPQGFESNRVFGQRGLSSNRAIHYGFGVEQEITRQVELSVEGFYKQLDNLVTPRAGNAGRGQAYGIEMLLRYRPDARFFGWLAYTLSESVRRDTPADEERLSPFSQTHILTVLGSYRLGRGWEVGATFRLVSGNLITSQVYGFYDENVGVYLPLLGYPPYSERLPMFHQLNVRIDKTWRFSGWSLSTYLDVYNAYNAANVEGVLRNYNHTQQAYAQGIPFLPSIGVRGEL